MLRLKTFVMFALSVCLFSMNQILSAESFNEDAFISLTQDPQLMLRKQHRSGCDNRDNRNCDRRIRPLRLRDFEGAWVFSRETVGGLGGVTSTGTPSEGSAAILDGQAVFDRNGHGVVNFASAAVYNGTPGAILNITIPPGQATITITITDPVNGIGTLAVSDPLQGFDADLIAIRSKSTGRVIRFIGHRTSVPTGLGNDGVTHYIFERQFQ